MAEMAAQQTGIWLVGARGGVAATVAVGLCALKRGLAPRTGLVTELPEFASTELQPWENWVIGGHEIRGHRLSDSVGRLEAQQGAIPYGSADTFAAELAEIDERIRPGITYQSGPAIDSLAESDQFRLADTPRQAIELIGQDLRDFAEQQSLKRVIVVLLNSTEPPVDLATLPTSWELLNKSLELADACPLRASSLYSIAAIECGMPVVNFTPSLGPCCTAIDQLARSQSVPYAGSDGKTGETLIKSVLAPMFSARHLEVMSWVGHNLLGNQDGQVLSDPQHKLSKVNNKENLLQELLGDQSSGTGPQSHVSIEAINSLGDWKTAWNHLHFKGFLGVPMTMQFTWQGCDSVLAAPLVMDLARLAEMAHRRGESGALTELSAFFKQPLGDGSLAFADQMKRLFDWARSDLNC